MFDLSTIKKMNRAQVRIEDNHNRECSWTGDETGIVLHSAKFRNTVFLVPWQAKLFLKKWPKVKIANRNSFIEGYFE